jgi:outer membrane receptor protein involved in Fe transport
VDNQKWGRVHGVEMSSIWDPADRWRVQLAYSYLHIALKTSSGSRDLTSTSISGEDLTPTHQFNVLTTYEFHPDLHFSLVGRFVDELPEAEVDGYFELDATIQWNVSEHLDIVLAGRNLLSESHQESVPTFFPTTSTEIEREVYLKLLWQY